MSNRNDDDDDDDVYVVLSRCSRWWSFNVEANSAGATSDDGQGKSEGTEDATVNATEALKTQLAEIEVLFVFLFYFVVLLHRLRAFRDVRVQSRSRDQFLTVVVSVLLVWFRGCGLGLETVQDAFRSDRQH